MIEHGFNYTDSTLKEMTDFFETRVKNLKPKEDEKKSSAVSKKKKDNKSIKKQKRVDSTASVVETSEESVHHRFRKTYCILYRICSHTTNKCKNLKVLINKQKQKEKKKFKEQKRTEYSN